MSRCFPPLALVLGLAYLVVLPPLQAPDEVAHLYRAVELSEGVCIPDPQTTVPKTLVDWARLYPPQVELDHRVTFQEFTGDYPGKSTPKARMPLPFLASNIYSCIPYVPAAAGIAFGRVLGMRPFWVHFLGRFANILVFAGLVTVSLSLLPGFRLLLFCLALMPMTLQQAASVSADSFTLGITFLFTAYVIFLAFGPIERIRIRQMAAAAALAAVMTVCKFNPWPVLLVALISPAKLGGKQRWIVSVFAVLLIAIGTAGVARWANNRNAAAFVEDRRMQGKDVDANTRFIRQNPATYAAVVSRSIPVQGVEYLREFVGKLGSLSLPLPGWIAWVYVILLLVAAAVSAGPVVLGAAKRLLIAGIGVMSVLSMFVLLWVFEADAGAIREAAVGQGVNPRLQGRYFIPVSFVFLLAFGVRRIEAWLKRGARSQKLLMTTVVLVVVFVAARGLEMMWSTYYRNDLTPLDDKELAGHEPESEYEGMLVRRPGAAPEDGMVHIVWNGRKRWVMDGQWLLAYGFKWPEDVVVIPAKDLARIRLGPPIPPNAIGMPPSRPSDSSPFERRLIRRPGATLEDGKVYLVLHSAKHWVMDSRWIVRHGFRWPEDVQTVSREDLDSIPIGPPIPPLP